MHSKSPSAESEDRLLQDLYYMRTSSKVEPLDYRPQLLPSDFTGDPVSVFHLKSKSGWDRNRYMPLYTAAQEGDWESARELFEVDPTAITAEITNFAETTLHVAAGAGHSRFVEELVKLMPSSKALELQETQDGDTALHIAAIAGMTRAAKAMVDKNPNLTQTRNKAGWVPLLSAASYVSLATNEQQKEMVEYLCTVTRDEEPSPFSGHLGARLICTIIIAGFYGIALSLVQRYPNLAIEKDDGGVCALKVIAEQPLAFRSGSHMTFLQGRIYKCISLDVPSTSHIYHHTIKGDTEDPSEIPRDPISSRGLVTKLFDVTCISEVFQRMNELVLAGIKHVPAFKQAYNQKLMHTQALALVKCIFARLSLMSNSEIIDFFTTSETLRAATTSGIVELVAECVQTFPFEVNKQAVLQIAIEQKHVKIFKLIRAMNVDKKLVSIRDEFGNTILHLAAKLAPSHQLNWISGPAFQMQRELRWFKAVEKIALNKDKLLKNNDGKTARALFTEEHKGLVERGEKWMKGTAESSMLVGALIATVVFAAAFTVPGGNFSDNYIDNGPNNGTPIYLKKNLFMVFAIADALALFSSITSATMFLSILTARYAEEDFLSSLPRRLIMNLATLFFSIFNMLIAFCAALAIVLEHRVKFVIVPIALIVSVPVYLFARLLFPLLLEMVHSTFGLPSSLY